MSEFSLWGKWLVMNCTTQSLWMDLMLSVSRNSKKCNHCFVLNDWMKYIISFKMHTTSSFSENDYLYLLWAAIMNICPHMYPWVYILPQNFIFSPVRANVSLMILVQKNLFTGCELKKFGLLSIFKDIFANFCKFRMVLENFKEIFEKFT